MHLQRQEAATYLAGLERSIAWRLQLQILPGLQRGLDELCGSRSVPVALDVLRARDANLGALVRQLLSDRHSAAAQPVEDNGGSLCGSLQITGHSNHPRRQLTAAWRKKTCWPRVGDAESLASVN